MRRAWKEGRYLRKAPFGYVNTIVLLHPYRPEPLPFRVYSMGEIPLRGFLDCPQCNRVLIGSASKGRKQYYHYYHCSSSCGVRFKAGERNDRFVHELKKFKPLPGMGEIYKELISEAYHSDNTSKLDNRKAIIKGINEENERISKARDLLLSDDIDAQDFIKSESTQKINELELRRYACEDIPKIEIKPLLNKAFEVGNYFRTTRLNTAVDLIYQMNNQLRGKKNGTKPVKSALYQRVDPHGLEPKCLVFWHCVFQR